MLSRIIFIKNNYETKRNAFMVADLHDDKRCKKMGQISWAIPLHFCAKKRGFFTIELESTPANSIM
jgi:hypothetical protein